MPSSSRVIGIDLGTTNSCAAVVEGPDQRVKLIPYRGGEYTIPSIYAIDDKGNELVGHEAKRQWQLNPRRTVYGSKRLLGRPADPHVVSEVKQHFAYEVVESSDQSQMEIALANQRLSMQAVSAKILQKIRDVASDYLESPVSRAVITVPAYFTDRQRQAVRDAGESIGLSVLGIINEPTAAALAFGVGRSLKSETVAIYDLGGGTFDISVIEIRDRIFEVKATGGDVFLGGVDFDQRIMDHVLARFAEKNPGVDLRRDPVAMQRIRDLAERTKIDLSNRKEAPFNLPFISMRPDGAPVDVDLRLTREDLEALTADLVLRTIETCRRVCRDAKLEPGQVDHVLLVGGQTRMPVIQKAVSEVFGKAPSKSVNPDEAVAIGAAMYAYSFEDHSNLRLMLLDVIPMAIGIEDAAGRAHTIFARNTPVPNAKAIAFTTSFDDQPDLVMRICQGDHPVARHNERIGEFTFSGIRAGPAGSVHVEVVFALNRDGILEMSARDKDTGRQMVTTVQLGNPG